MTTIEVARKVLAEGCHLVRPKKDGAPGYDIKPMFTGSRQGWFYVDTFSASAILAVHKALSEENRARLGALSIHAAARIAFKLLKRDS